MRPETRAVCIPSSESYVRESLRTGSEYRVLVAWPEGEPPPGGFPSIWLLDGNSLFGTVVETIRMRSRRPDVTGVPPAVVVGLGSPDPNVYDRERRILDYTPYPPEATGANPEGGRDLPTGGADDFLAFLESELKPDLASRFPISERRQTLFGHSLGGLFTLHVLASGRSTFDGFVASSPSIWWSRERVLDGLSGVAAGPGQPGDRTPRVMIAVGEYEEELAPHERSGAGAAAKGARRAERRMVSDASEAAARLAPLTERGGRVHLEVFPGEDHASTTLLAVGRCLRMMLRP
jgi:predicted alpha/beta superfamily hydrolase